VPHLLFRVHKELRVLQVPQDNKVHRVQHKELLVVQDHRVLRVLRVLKVELKELKVLLDHKVFKEHKVPHLLSRVLKVFKVLKAN
jgi:hypothetical protein